MARDLAAAMNSDDDYSDELENDHEQPIPGISQNRADF